jgi:hypothetical protein
VPNEDSLLTTPRDRAILAALEEWTRRHGEPPATRGDDSARREVFVLLLRMCLDTDPDERQVVHLLAVGSEEESEWDALQPLARQLLALKNP